MIRSLPAFAVQPSLPNVIADIARPHSDIATEHAWVSAYAHNRTLHARIRVSEGPLPGQVDCDPADDRTVTVQLRSPEELVLACPALHLAPTAALLPSPRLNLARPPNPDNPHTLEAPAPALVALRPGAVDSLALAPAARSIALAGRDGQARVLALAHLDDGSIRLGPETRLRGHVGDVVACHFAPSGEVVVTAASDMTIRVFSALDGSSPRVAPLPPRRPTALVPLVSPSSAHPALHKGRHLVAASLAGTLTLVDLAPAPPAPLRTWALAHPVTACVVIVDPAEPEDPDDVGQARYALAGCADGTVHLVPLSLSSSPTRRPRLLLRAPGPSAPVDALAARLEPDGAGWTVALGTRAGLVAVYSVTVSALVPLALSSPPSPSDGDALPLIDPRAAWRRAASPSARIHALALSPRRTTSGPRAAATTVPSLSPSPGPGPGPGRTAPAPAPATQRTASVLVAPADGLAYRATFLDRDGRADEVGDGADAGECEVAVVEELVGLECGEPATCVVEDAVGRVWLAGAGGAVRVYERG
ncbi:hypothetical protein JCM3770_003254 [Rhodotorula araucariae]